MGKHLISSMVEITHLCNTVNQLSTSPCLGLVLQIVLFARRNAPSRRHLMSHEETHRSARIGWLRAVVLGANDGIVSTASLVVGVAAAGAETKNILITGAAGLVAGAMSMAAGEYVSVSSQADTERADLARETRELAEEPDSELKELTGIYIDRGVEPELARRLAEQLTAQNALAAHARDELGISEIHTARPLQAALASAVTFAVGAALPLLVTSLTPKKYTIAAVSVAALIGLASLGALAAQAGKARIGRAVLRVTFWGGLALVVTALVGKIFGVVL
jgi:vacuolar iron transporter family protein